MATELQSLTKIFNHRIFRIPDYQRGYAWESRQLKDFWSDLKRVGSDRYHYCGQLTLERASKTDWKQWDGDDWLVDEADFEPYFVVDGQQRLMTSVILIQCLLEEFDARDLLAQQKVAELRERFLVRGNGVLKSCIFGYAKDNPSHEFFRTQVLGVPSNEYHGVRTVYTAKLELARDFFRRKLSKLKLPADRDLLFRGVAQRFRFILHELSTDIDVFVAFETMNNRGKPLSRLELLKNRLIYLSTLANGSEAERNKVRKNINAAWRTVYEELGKNQQQSLDDDEFLRAHWIVFFGYDKDQADPLTQFLLNTHFTAERLDNGKISLDSIQAYADSLQISAKVWQKLHFPEEHSGSIEKRVRPHLLRLKRLGFGVLRPMLLAALSTEQQEEELISLLYQAERFLLLVRSFAGTRSNIGEADSYRLAHQIHRGAKAASNASAMLANRVKRHFSATVLQTEIDELFADEDGKGYYQLPGLKFVLFEYEEHLRRKAKASESKISWEDFRGAKNSVEHIYPQNPEEDSWPAFGKYRSTRQRFLTHTIGNLVAVSVAKNSSLSRSSFKNKKKGTSKVPGFSQGSFSELKIAQCKNWTPTEILERGLQLLAFIEERWEVDLGTENEKVALLKLNFVTRLSRQNSSPADG